MAGMLVANSVNAKSRGVRSWSSGEEAKSRNASELGIQSFVALLALVLGLTLLVLQLYGVQAASWRLKTRSFRPAEHQRQVQPEAITYKGANITRHIRNPVWPDPMRFPPQNGDEHFDPGLYAPPTNVTGVEVESRNHHFAWQYARESGPRHSSS